MQFPAGITATDFLQHYWQRQPLYVRQGFTADLPILDGDELAWLALQPDVEARLVFTDRTPAGKPHRYRVRQGPFDEAELRQLPTTDWTLLVQDVEKHLPDLRAWLELVEFIPQWRVDDLMFSVAAPGGSVGPHRDNYDVFLCQLSGGRNWNLASASAELEIDEHAELSLLRPFDDDDPVTADGGDVLYLPPQVAHWGVAADACVTCSIGMRAPTVAELRCTFERELPHAANPFVNNADERQTFFRDPDLAAAEASDGSISARAVDRCRQLLADGDAVTDRELAIALGCTVTDTKAWLAPEGDTAPTPSTGVLDVHGMARVTWWQDTAATLLFVNGHHYRLPKSAANACHAICLERRISATEWCDSIPDSVRASATEVGLFAQSRQ